MATVENERLDFDKKESDRRVKQRCVELAMENGGKGSTTEQLIGEAKKLYDFITE